MSESKASNSGGCARSAGRIAAGALALVLVLGLPLSLLAFDWARVFFDPERMSAAVGQHLLDSGVLRQAVADSLLRGEGGEGVQAFRHLDEAGRQKLLDILIPPGWAQAQLERVMHDLYAWFDDDRPAPKLTLDIGPLKDRLMGGGAQELATLLMDSWPPCGPDQLAQLSQERIEWEGLSEGLQCSPPEPLRSTMIEQGAQLVQRQIRQLPDVVPLGEGAGDAAPQDVDRLKQGIRLLRAFTRWGWLLPLSTLGLITALVVRSWPQLLRWWGGPLAGAGVVGLFLLMGAGTLARRMTVQVTDTGQLPPIFNQAMQAVVDGLVDDMLGMLLAESVVFLLLGAGLWGIGAYLGRRAPATTT